jgi:hypothetical protein
VTSCRGLLGGFAALLLAGCMTGYQPHGMTGGHQERKLDEDMYHVSFHGNGNTPRAVVLKYFLYRCAELTLERGYDYFELYAPERAAALPDEPRFVKTQYTYTITTWSASAIVRMYPKDLMMSAPTLFSAREVVGLLGADVRSGSPGHEIPAKLRAVEGNFPVLPESYAKARTRPSAPAAGAVQLDDLKDLLPK